VDAEWDQVRPCHLQPQHQLGRFVRIGNFDRPVAYLVNSHFTPGVGGLQQLFRVRWLKDRGMYLRTTPAPA
jgi:hypothetical protein